jgi:hypothetical protein
MQKMFKELYDQTVLWQMSPSERMAMFYIFNKMPMRRTAIEIGSFKGGFTKVLSEHFKRVISIDIDHSNIVDKEAYNNVTWLTGTSAEWLSIMAFNVDVDFILVDGDHTYESVFIDLDLILYHLKSSALVLVHDAEYSESKKALQDIVDKYKNEYDSDLYFVRGDEFKGNKVGGLALFKKKCKITNA